MGFWDWIADTVDTAATRGRSRPVRDMFNVWGLARNEINKSFRDWESDPNSVRNLGRQYSSFNAPKSLRRQPPGPPTTDEILAHLESLQDPSRYLMGMGDLNSQAMAAASAQYDPLISALQQQMGSASSRANRNKDELGRMFSSLSADLQGDIPEIQQMYSQTKQQSKSDFDQLESNIQQTYDTSAAEQEAMMRRLNIEAAAAEVLPEQQKDRDYFAQLAARDASVEQTALGQEERASVDYTRQGSEIARLEGTQRQANLMADLADLLGQYESQIGSHRAAKQQAYTANLGELQNQAMSDAMDRSQRDFQNFIAMIQLGRDLRKDEVGKPTTSVKSPADVAGRAIGLGLGERSAQNIQDVFMSSIGSDPSILGGINPASGSAMSKEALTQRILEAGRANGLSRSELNALQVIALEYFGRR